MSRLLAAITLPLSIALTILVTVICSVPIIVAGLIKTAGPHSSGMALYIRFLQFYDVLLVRRLALLLHLNPWLNGTSRVWKA